MKHNTVFSCVSMQGQKCQNFLLIILNKYFIQMNNYEIKLQIIKLIILFWFDAFYKIFSKPLCVWRRNWWRWTVVMKPNLYILNATLYERGMAKFYVGGIHRIILLLYTFLALSYAVSNVHIQIPLNAMFTLCNNNMRQVLYILLIIKKTKQRFMITFFLFTTWLDKYTPKISKIMRNQYTFVVHHHIDFVSVSHILFIDLIIVKPF